jgi:hypothetical protein
MSGSKNEAAQKLGQLRWKGKTKAERAAHSKMMLDARYNKPKSEAEKKGV